jgi:hypothetical protein
MRTKGAASLVRPGQIRGVGGSDFANLIAVVLREAEVTSDRLVAATESVCRQNQSITRSAAADRYKIRICAPSSAPSEYFHQYSDRTDELARLRP